MRRCWISGLAAFGIAFGVVSSAGAAPVGYVARPAGGEFYGVDLGAASATQLGTTTDIRGLAVGPDGTLYGVTAFASPADRLVTVNKTTGAATVVGSLGYSQQGAGLSFTADGSLWTTRIASSDGPSSLYAVNPATGATTLVGVNGAGISISGLAGGCDGTLWGLGAQTGTAFLFRIDTTTGTATPVGSGLGGGIGGGGNAFGFDADASGTLWGIDASARQFVVNSETGAAASVQTISGITSSNSISSLGIAPIGSCEVPPGPPDPPVPPDPPAPPATPVTGVQPSFTG